jgi:predicted phosphohydrolase
MQFAFDLISDLHIETWPQFDWKDQATSPFCVVAGDVAKDRQVVYDTLKHLSECYQAVFYIDGNDEHINFMSDLGGSYAHLTDMIGGLNNVVYLQDNVVVIDGVAIVGTNGWWTYNFDLGTDTEQSEAWWRDKHQLTMSQGRLPAKMGTTDATYMVASIKRLQTHNDVKKIVCVTHTVPDPDLVSHDIELAHTHRLNCMGNRYMTQVLEADTEHKMHTWCFGHYHGSIDQVRNGVRYVNNCRGRGDTQYSQYVYFPRRIVVEV